MNRRRFLYCLDCNAVHRVTPFDTAPVFEIDAEDFKEIPRDDRRDFLDRHSGHGIGELLCTDEQRWESDGLVDPVKVNYFEVTDGRETFVVRSFRASIAEPLAYEVLPRQLTFWDVARARPRNRRKVFNRDSQRRYAGPATRKKAPVASILTGIEAVL